MSVYNFFKNIFGIPSGNDGSDNSENQRSNYSSDEFQNPVWNEEKEEDYRDTPGVPEGYSHHGFSMFTDPLEMQRYFEQQMDEVMKSFEGFFRSDESSPFAFGGFLTPNVPEYPQIEPPSGNLKDHYLKPGYERPRYNGEKSVDTDLDGKVDIGSLDSIFEDKPKQQIVPYQPSTAPQTSYFGKSISSRTVQRPDGSIEIHRTTRDHEGNEETTVTRQMGDRKYTVTTKKDKDGKEEKIEDIVNMEEKDVSQFMDIWRPKQPQQDDPNKYFPFDRFFKR